MNTSRISKLDFNFPIREKLVEFIAVNFDRFVDEIWTLVPYSPFCNYYEGRLDMYELKCEVSDASPIILRFKFLKVFLKMLININSDSTAQSRIFYLLDELSNNLSENDLVIITDSAEHGDLGTTIYAP